MDYIFTLEPENHACFHSTSVISDVDEFGRVVKFANIKGL